MRKVFKVVLVIVLVLIVAVFAIGAYVKTALPNVGAASTINVISTPEKVERGRYLANHVMVCMDCHSQRDWSYYAGPYKKETFGGGGERFGKEVGLPGTLYSKNITPYGLHNWTDGEILRAFTSGVTKDGSALFPLMPYGAYGQMDTLDAYCVIAYLRSLPSLKNDVPARSLDFPVNFIVNTMPAKATFSAMPDTNNILAYGAYVTKIAGCVECHSKVDKGAKIAGTEFGGGRVFDEPNGTYTTSANITSDIETGIGSWTREMFVQRFKQYTDSSYHPNQLAKDDFNTIMPWMMYSGMTEKDLTAIYVYLRSVKPIKNKVQKFGRKV